MSVKFSVKSQAETRELDIPIVQLKDFLSVDFEAKGNAVSLKFMVLKDYDWIFCPHGSATVQGAEEYDELETGHYYLRPGPRRIQVSVRNSVFLGHIKTSRQDSFNHVLKTSIGKPF